MIDKPYSLKPAGLRKTALSGPNGVIEFYTPFVGEDKFWCDQLNAAFEAGTRFADHGLYTACEQAQDLLREYARQFEKQGYAGFQALHGVLRDAIAKAAPANGGAK